MIKKTLGKIYRTTFKYKKVIIAILIIYAFWFFGLGIIGGWLISKGTLSSFPDFTKEDRILILAPHIDDEIIGAGGIIQQAVAKEASVKVVYMTNGDDNLGSVLSEDKTLEPTPDDFIALGEQRVTEGKKATKLLGLNEENLIFLGYPDKGLSSMLNNNFNTPYTSQSTRFNYNPYQGTYRSKQSYTGANVVDDLKKIISDYKPNIIFVSHPRDQHPDHSSTYLFMEKSLALAGLEKKPQVYTYLVHYSLYPPNKSLQTNRFLHPPKRLFTKEGWYSFDLTDEQENKKLDALNQNLSQIKSISFTGTFGSFMKSFVKRNEIFELMD
ncbi:MAG: PIG-L family deacetylase [Patescibacteria group bacterium]|nr:PIG-L family deacetylase [Patescibacteria group bacterium]